MENRHKNKKIDRMEGRHKKDRSQLFVISHATKKSKLQSNPATHL